MRKLILSLVIGLALLFNTTAMAAESLASQSLFNKSLLNLGVVKISYTSKVEKLKVMIAKDGKSYTYNLRNDGVEESFPLQMGNGEYKVSVLENITGDRYKYISTENVKLSLSNANAVYLSSTQNVEWDESKAAIKKAAELTKNLTSDEEKLNAIYAYVVSTIKYDYNKLQYLKSDYLPDIDATLRSKTGICFDYAAILGAMLRSQGIPTKLIKGYSTNVTGYHAWNEVYNSKTNSWIIIDTTYDSQMKDAKAKYSMIKPSTQYTKVSEY